MTQEDKNLLLKDLCARLPHRVMVKISGAWFYDKEEDYDINLTIATCRRLAQFERGEIDLKPYLRPMSSMTEEEINEFILISDTVLWIGSKRSTCILSLEQMDWLNEHHFDYRNLIEKGLALKAPEGVYNN